ncbi:MAG TPA: hypothetical protein VM659_28565 [Dongiaceae bacterium]|nr:hypothetical protein [Dongiaceae bacterium]
MLSIVCFKWKPKGAYRSIFGAQTVNILKRMVDRHYANPHRVICVTDDARDIDPDIEIMPLWDDHANVPSPHGAGNPSCYRRLKAYSKEASDWFGPRFVILDLDCVIVRDMVPVWDTPADFCIWGDTNPMSPYNGSMQLMNTGARSQVWETFDPVESPKRSKAMGYFGSDQGWIAACLGPNENRWSTVNGVYSYRNHIARAAGKLPPNARIVFFHGQTDPWHPQAQALDWVKEHYR